MTTLSPSKRGKADRRAAKKSAGSDLTPDGTVTNSATDRNTATVTAGTATAGTTGDDQVQETVFTYTDPNVNVDQMSQPKEGVEPQANEHESSPVNGMISVYEEPILTQLIVKRYLGEKKKGLYDGEDGEAYFRMGHHYQGTFLEGLMHGKGTYTWCDGTVYKGEFDKNHITGKGVYKWINGSTYDGEVVDGLRHGFGTFQHQMGTSSVSYTGEWCEGEKDGKGRMDYDSEGFSFYEGDWVKNVRHGYGTRQYPSGNFYQGMWFHNIRHGEGMMRWLDSDQLYTGQWNKGIQDGLGQQLWFLSRLSGSQYALRNMYDGEFLQGYRHGYGVFYYANGACYEGEWLNNMKHGKGKFTFKNGRIYEGLFDKDHIAEFPQFEMDGVTTPDLSMIRTRTPLPADQLSVRSNESRNTYGPSFQLDIQRLLNLLPEEDHEEEAIQVIFVMMRHTSMLKKVYNFYSCLGYEMSPDNTFVMNRMQFWRLLKDCRLHHSQTGLCTMDRIIAEHNNMPLDGMHYPYAKILFREFTNYLIVLAHHIYAKEYNGVGPLLACCLSKLINENILPHACTVKSYIYNETRRAVNAFVHVDESYEVFKEFSTRQKRSPFDTQLTMRQFLFLLEDLNLINDDLTAKAIIGILSSDDPNVIIMNEINLELEMTFLEFFEALIGCAEAFSTVVVLNESSSSCCLETAISQSVTSVGSASRPITQSVVGLQSIVEEATDGVVSIVPPEGASEPSAQQRSSLRTGITSATALLSVTANSASENKATSEINKSDVLDGSAAELQHSQSNASCHSVVIETGPEGGATDVLEPSVVSFVASRPNADDDIAEVAASVDGEEVLAEDIGRREETSLHERTRQFNFWTHQVHIFFMRKFFPAVKQLGDVRQRVIVSSTMQRICPLVAESVTT